MSEYKSTFQGQYFNRYFSIVYFIIPEDKPSWLLRGHLWHTKESLDLDRRHLVLH